jgi:glycosyltransferase involved in cell wall biosynthesis
MDIPTYARLYVGRWAVRPAWALFRTVHNIADVNLVPSSWMLRDVRENGYKRVRWWRRGIDLERFRPDLRSPEMRARLSGGRPGEFLALYVGRISREKNVQHLRALAGQPGVRLALVGGGPELDQFRALFAGTEAVFTGFLRGDDVVSAYASADALVFPSTSETFGLAPLEAMACGLPVIGTLRGGVVDTLRDGVNALVYDPEQPEQIVTRVLELQRAPELHQELRAGALAYASERSWQSTMDQLIDFYELAIRAHRQGQIRRRLGRLLFAR